MYTNEQAVKQAKALNELIEKRKMLEISWKKKGETLLIPTDKHFPDIHGYTLLDYAVMRGDLDDLNELLMGKEETNARRSKQALSLALQVGNEEIANLLLAKGYEISEKSIGSIETSKIHDPKLKKEIERQVTNLKKKSEPKEQSHVYLNKELIAAIKEQNIEKVKELIQTHKIDISATDQTMRSVIHHAVMADSVPLLEYFLSLKGRYNLQDMYGINPFHLCKSKEMMVVLKRDENIQKLINMPDLFGNTPLKLAINAKKDEVVEAIQEDSNAKYKESAEYGKDIVKISQSILISKLKYFLTLTNENEQSFFEEGLCNGLSFLWLYYTDRNKEDEFFAILKIISEWDGSWEGLEDTKKVQALSGDFANVRELFRYISDHAIWFQQSTIDEDLQKLNPTQESRVEQFELIKKDDKDFSLEKLIEAKNTMTKKELLRYLETFNQIPGAKIEIGGGKHACCMYVKGKNEILFYDPNQPLRLLPFSSVTALVEFIANHKYRFLNFSSTQMDIHLVCYKPNHFNAVDFRYFEDNELPKNQEEFDSSKSKLLPKKNPFMTAVRFESLPNIEYFLSSNEIKLEQEEVEKALKFAFKKKNLPMINTILKYGGKYGIKQYSPLGVAIKLEDVAEMKEALEKKTEISSKDIQKVIKSDNKEMLELILKHATSLTGVDVKEILSSDYYQELPPDQKAKIAQMVFDKGADPNYCYEYSRNIFDREDEVIRFNAYQRPILFWAIEQGDIPLLEILLKKKATIDQVCEVEKECEDLSVNEHYNEKDQPIKDTLLTYAIKNKPEHVTELLVKYGAKFEIANFLPSLIEKFALNNPQVLLTQGIPEGHKAIEYLKSDEFQHEHKEIIIRSLEQSTPNVKRKNITPMKENMKITSGDLIHEPKARAKTKPAKWKKS